MAVLCLLVCGATLVVLLLAVRSFGAYTERLERANTLTRQSNELTRQSNERVRSEIGANGEENSIVHEKTLAVFAEVARLRRELQDTLNERSA